MGQRLMVTGQDWFSDHGQHENRRALHLGPSSHHPQGQWIPRATSWDSQLVRYHDAAFETTPFGTYHNGYISWNYGTTYVKGIIRWLSSIFQAIDGHCQI